MFYMNNKTEDHHTLQNLYLYILFLILNAACQQEDMTIPINDVTDVEFHANIKENGNPNSPLTALIITFGKVEHSVEISIKGKFDNDLSYKDNTLSRSHEIPLIGLYPAYNNIIYIRALDANDKLLAAKELSLQTDPADVDLPEIEIIHYEPGVLAGRLTFVEYRLGFTNVPFVFDEYGDVRWYLKYPDQSLIRPTLVKNTRNFYCGDFGYHVMYKYDWLGNGDTIPLPDGFKMLHHEVYRYNSHLFFPADKDYILECDENGNKINEWNLGEIVKRYLPGNQQLVIDDKDWLHVNSVYYQEVDQSLVVSARQSLGVIKLDYHSGNIRWILNDTSASWYNYPKLKDLALQPSMGCDLPLGQHSPVPLPGNRILMLDNGYDGYERLNNEDGLTDGGKGYSRLVVYKIDEATMTVSQEFQYGQEHGATLYSRFAGNAGYDPAIDSYFGLFGKVQAEEGDNTIGRVMEVDAEGNLLFDAKLTSMDPGEMFFRSEKINLDQVINEY
jgi:arylsulfate sulfotransferase